MKKLLFASILLLAVLLVLFIPARAQDEAPEGPIYVVQPGDTLSSIALRFGVTVEDLVQANLLANPNQLQVGDRLVIPGLRGVEGVLTTEVVPFGESVRSMSRRYRISVDQLARLNRLVSPAELYVGSQLVLPVEESRPPAGGRAALVSGQSLLELAVVQDANPWTLALVNRLANPQVALPGDVLFVAQGESAGPGALPPAIRAVEVSPFPLVQGKTAVVRTQADAGVSLEGEITTADLRTNAPISSTLHFFPAADGGLIALQGVHAMAQPGLYPLTLRGSLPGGGRFAFTQFVAVREGGYGFDRPLEVDPETLDPAVTEPEDAYWTSLTEAATPQKYWEGIFLSPSPFPDCWNSLFGWRRSYNGSAYNYYHTGLDFCGGTGIEIRAPAAGRVVFAGPLVVRGNATVIDHGWGVYSAYMHQSEIRVQEGDQVVAGQVIGLVGATGRVEGAHLHWEIIVGGTRVDPLEWLERAFP